jgi:hypothetical protein
MVCDGCQILFKSNGKYGLENREWLATLARHHGWEVSKDGKCYCPECNKKNIVEGNNVKN